MKRKAICIYYRKVTLYFIRAFDGMSAWVERSWGPWEFIGGMTDCVLDSVMSTLRLTLIARYCSVNIVSVEKELP